MCAVGLQSQSSPPVWRQLQTSQNTQSRQFLIDYLFLSPKLSHPWQVQSRAGCDGAFSGSGFVHEHPKQCEWWLSIMLSIIHYSQLSLGAWQVRGWAEQTSSSSQQHLWVFSHFWKRGAQLKLCDAQTHLCSRVLALQSECPWAGCQNFPAQSREAKLRASESLMEHWGLLSVLGRVETPNMPVELPMDQAKPCPKWGGTLDRVLCLVRNISGSTQSQGCRLWNHKIPQTLIYWKNKLQKDGKRKWFAFKGSNLTLQTCTQAKAAWLGTVWGTCDLHKSPLPTASRGTKKCSAKPTFQGSHRALTQIPPTSWWVSALLLLSEYKCPCSVQCSSYLGH